MIRLSVAKEFSRTPGPRRSSEGKFSGEDFLVLLRQRFDEARAQSTRLLVDLDGAAGYATSFLEAAFGGLAREEDPQTVLDTLEFKSNDEPDLIAEIRQYIQEARP
jgi:hypothetical protein